MTLRTVFAASAVALLCGSFGIAATEAHAASVSHTGTYALSPYLNEGSYTFPAASFPKFDLAGQCLTSVCVQLDGGVAGLVNFENYQDFPVTVNVIFTAKITLQRPDLTTLLTVQPSTTVTDNLPVFDGDVDYAGASGRSYPDVSATQSDNGCFTSAADLALFSGAGTIALPAFATDLSSQTGASSWSIGVRAYASVTLTYTYIACAVPTDRATWAAVKNIYR